MNFNFAEWDTAMVLTVVFGPLCFLLFSIVFMQWQRINELKNDLSSSLTKTQALQKQADENAAASMAGFDKLSKEHANEVKRQQEEIDRLHGVIKALEEERESSRRAASARCG